LLAEEVTAASADVVAIVRRLVVHWIARATVVVVGRQSAHADAKRDVGEIGAFGGVVVHCHARATRCVRVGHTRMHHSRVGHCHVLTRACDVVLRARARIVDRDAGCAVTRN